MAPEGREEALSAAEARLLALLAVLRAEAPRPEDSLTEAIMRSARWQYALRATARLVGDLVAILADGLALFLGLERRGGDR